ncbi:hypothetical protein YTPLAS18_03140 [Nitrospira sp.]|nr:hypothetical protein YTPLAS18_03140 [Nitrospira sp.]
MKFVCLNCETYMNFQKVEQPAEGSLGVFFGCPSCGAKFSMVTNPGETQMVSSLGVKLGGRQAPVEPFEMTRGTLKDEAKSGMGQMAAYLNEKIGAGQSSKPVESPSIPGGVPKEGEKSGGSCPFAAVVAQMGMGSSGKVDEPGKADFTWTPDAKERLERLPSFVKPMVQASVESYARRQSLTTISLQVMDDAKSEPNGIAWTSEAEQRLENIPDFIRPMARREIERIAKERGAASVTATIMDEAKDKFLKFM